MDYDTWRLENNEAYYFNCDKCEMKTDLDDICQTDSESFCPECYQKELER